MSVILIIAIILLILLLTSIIYIALIKRDIAHVTRQIELINKVETNAKLTSISGDQAIGRLAVTINEILLQQKSIYIVATTANRELKQAITNISHDLRTPLTSAIGYIQLAQSGTLDPKKHEEYLSIVERRLRTLSNLMNDLFEFTQIIEGKTAAPEMNDINAVISEVIAEFYDDFVQQNITPNIALCDGTWNIICAPSAIKRIFQNLCKNALTHGEQNFSVTIDKEKSTITFSNNVAVNTEIDVERIFERFYTGDYSRNQQSTGLGLAITKELVEQIGGKISSRLDNNILYITICFMRNSL